jgi:hypothetical protein
LTTRDPSLKRKRKKPGWFRPYLNPPENAIVLCVDEKSQIQALDRTEPTSPMQIGMPERQTHDYIRNGTTTLFAAPNIATGQTPTALR